MVERGLLMGDMLHILKYGFVYDEAVESTQAGLFKYSMESTSPNSGGRTVKIVVIPSSASALKIVTVMWKDDR